MKWSAFLPPLLMLAGAALSMTRTIQPLHGFYFFLCGGLLGAIGVVGIGSYHIFHRDWPNWANLFLSGIPMLVLFVIVVSAIRSPMMNDFSTDVTTAPEFSEGLSKADPGLWNEERMNLQKAAGGEASTLIINGPVEPVLKAAESLLWEKGWFKLSQRSEGESTIIEGYVESKIFRFRDDFVIRIRSHHGSNIIDMRSRSRSGRKDFRANEIRVREFLAELNGRARSRI